MATDTARTIISVVALRIPAQRCAAIAAVPSVRAPYCLTYRNITVFLAADANHAIAVPFHFKANLAIFRATLRASAIKRVFTAVIA